MRQELDPDDLAREILITNDRGSYTVPTAGLYPYQWNWDSAFAALGFESMDIDRAWRELETLFSGQWSNGMVPHILFHEQTDDYFPGPDVWGCRQGPIPSSGVSQPPVATTVARMLFEKNRAAGRSRIARLYPRMRAWHDWFMEWRVEKDAVCTIHPWESGRDNAADWDRAMSRMEPIGIGNYRRKDTSFVQSEMRPTKQDYDRYLWLVGLGRDVDWDDARIRDHIPFRIADPCLTFIMLRAARDLREMGTELGQDTSRLESDISRLENGTDFLWNADLQSFDSRDPASGEWSNCISNASYLCWYAGIESEDMRTSLRRLMELGVCGIPSLDPESEKFDRRRYWRGPVWAVMNFLVGLGLEEMEMPEHRWLRRQTREMIARSGFAEYYDPFTGEAEGGGFFTWTASIWLAWARET